MWPTLPFQLVFYAFFLPSSFHSGCTGFLVAPSTRQACSHPRLPCACLDSLQFLGYYPLESSSRCQAAFTAPPQRNS